MTNILKDIDDLNLFKKTGLIEIAKHNSLFSGYWEQDKKTILKNFHQLFCNNIDIFIPDIDPIHYKQKLVKDLDYEKPKLKYKKDDPNYHENRKKHLIQLTKDRYRTDEEFRQKAIKRSNEFYHKLKKQSNATRE